MSIDSVKEANGLAQVLSTFDHSKESSTSFL